MAEIFDELLLSDARGGRRPTIPISIEVERALTGEDLAELGATPPAAQRQTLSTIRYAHHQLARLLAQGTRQEEISLITGYSPAYISSVKNDPAFAELLSYYKAQRDEAFIDVVERMRSLGLSTLDELQRRLAEETGDWSKRELLDMAELMLVKPQAAKGAGAAPAAPPQVAVSVSFVSSETAKMVDVTPKELND